jgi:WD40 repeat protein
MLGFIQELCRRKDVFSEPSLMEFLELDTKVRSLLMKGPNLVGTHRETRSILDMHYWSEANMLMLVNADLSGFIQKSGLFSFGKKKEPTQTPGSVAGYCQSLPDDGQSADYNFKQQWWMNYPSASTRAVWSSKHGLLICGEDSGMMHFLKPCATNMLKCDELFVLKVHSDRMTSIAIDEERKLVYSVGEDRKFKVVDIDKKRVSSEFEISGKKVNCMHVDKESRTAYVGDAEGNVKVIDLSKNPPTCTNNIKVASKDSIVALNLVKNQLYSGCAETGKVFIHSLPDPTTSVDSAHIRLVRQH